MKDYQKQRVYNSERCVGPRLETVPQMQSYVDKMVKSAWWKKRYPRVKRIIVKDGRGRRRACAEYGYGYMVVKMPKWARNEGVLLHEMAHTVNMSVKHGPKYVGNYLAMIDKAQGREVCLKQMQSFRNANVDWKMPQWWK